ncbi:MAG: glycosyltransferase family 2 protein [Thiotrichales bacterium]
MIIVLIATYNGAEFLQAQLDSIANQSFQDFTVLIRDDGSIDETCELVSAHPLAERITLLRNEGGLRGARLNFSALLEEAAQSDASYFALADQDDIWYPDKLALQVEALASRERGEDLPQLVFCDATMINEDGQPIAPSFMRAQGLTAPSLEPLRTLLVHNVAAGNGMLFNRALLEAALPLPDAALMHDWWLMLVAGAKGDIHYIDSALLAYRQHQHNEIGVVTPLSLIKRPFASCSRIIREGQHKLIAGFSQARALSLQLADQNPDDSAIALINRFAELPNHQRLERMMQVKSDGFHAQGRLRQWWFMVRLWLIHTSDLK